MGQEMKSNLKLQKNVLSVKGRISVFHQGGRSTPFRKNFQLNIDLAGRSDKFFFVGGGFSDAPNRTAPASVQLAFSTYCCQSHYTFFTSEELRYCSPRKFNIMEDYGNNMDKFLGFTFEGRCQHSSMFSIFVYLSQLPLAQLQLSDIG